MASTLTKSQKNRIKAYFERKQYDQNNIFNNINEIFPEVVGLYNPIADIVLAITSNSLSDLTVEEKLLTPVWLDNNMNELSTEICSNMYLYNDTYVEVIINESKKIEYVLHNFENIEVDEDSRGINRFKVSGVIKEYTETGETINVDYSREYYKFKAGTTHKIVKKEKIGEEVITSIFPLDVIPVVKFKFGNTIYQILDTIDRINENEAYIRAIFTIHGDPILQANNVEKFADVDGSSFEEKNIAEEQQSALKKARYTRKTMVFTVDEKDRPTYFKYIELTNPLITEMQKDIERLKKDLMDRFPELILVDTTTQNVSTETFELKNSGLKSKLTNIRKAFLTSLIDVDNIALQLMHSTKRVTIDSYKYLDTFREQEKAVKLTTLKSATELLKELDDVTFVSEELSPLIQETTKEIVSDFNSLYT